MICKLKWILVHNFSQLKCFKRTNHLTCSISNNYDPKGTIACNSIWKGLLFKVFFHIRFTESTSLYEQWITTLKDALLSEYAFFKAHTALVRKVKNRLSHHMKLPSLAFQYENTKLSLKWIVAGTIHFLNCFWKPLEAVLELTSVTVSRAVPVCHTNKVLYNNLAFVIARAFTLYHLRLPYSFEFKSSPNFSPSTSNKIK